MRPRHANVYLIIFATLVLQACAAVDISKMHPEQIYTLGEQSFSKGKYEDAIEKWRKSKESYYSPDLSARSDIGIADAYFMNRDYIEAAAGYEDFIKLHPVHPKAEYALYRQAMSYYRQIHGIDTDQLPVINALAILDSYMKLYPNGENIQEVRETFKDCHKKQVEYEIYVGRFYLKTDKPLAAIGRFKDALTRFPDTSKRDELLFYLGNSYLEVGDKAKARNVFDTLVKEHPATPYSSKVPKNL